MLAAVPYYLLYVRDLESCGYRLTDVLRMYSFNLLLHSSEYRRDAQVGSQAFTGEPSPFIRTPKVPDRTAAPATYTLIPVLAMPWMVYVAIAGFLHSGYAFLVFGSLNVALLYALSCLHTLPIRMGRSPIEFQYEIFLLEGSASRDRAGRTIVRGSPRVSVATMSTIWNIGFPLLAKSSAARAILVRFALFLGLPISLALALVVWTGPSSAQTTPQPVTSLKGVRVAITVDDLPTHGDPFPGIDRDAISRAILAALANNNVKGAWGFTNEAWDEKEMDILREWLSGGLPAG